VPRDFLICTTVDPHRYQRLVPGSTKGYCTLCAVELWVSPTGQTIDADPVCEPCAKGARKSGKAGPIMVHERTQAELRANGISDDEVVGLIRDMQRNLGDG
jgi:hypothetical protein